MAEVKMDLSEYESMREVKNLLEDSLNKERILREEIERLNKEKIKVVEDVNKALLSAKMGIIKTVKNESREFLLRKKERVDYWSFFVPRGERPDGGEIMHRMANMGHEEFVNLFFDIVKIEKNPEIEITTHGLEEIKGEIRQEIDEETKNKLKNLEKASSEIGSLADSLRSEREVKYKIQSELASLKIDNDNLKKTIEDYKKFIQQVEEIASKKVGLFGRKDLIAEIKKCFIY